LAAVAARDSHYTDYTGYREELPWGDNRVEESMKDIQDRVDSPDSGPGMQGMQVEIKALLMDTTAASLTRVHGG